MTTPSPEERLRRLTANPGQPATKADIAELWSAIRIHDIERRSEMNRRESERNIRAIEFQSEMNRREIEFQSEMRRWESERKVRAIEFRSEMRTRESERMIEHYDRKRRKAEKRWDMIWRGSITLYVVLFVAAGIILANSLL